MYVETALLALKEGQHEYVLCDLKMYPEDGAEFARGARSESFGRDCAIILTTADREGAAELDQDGMNILVDAVLFKPFNVNELQSKLAKINDRRRSTGGA
jgi:CheY-like chemotaxis protein